jgi:hypothetical protein
MKLSDVFTDADELHRIMHEAIEEPRLRSKDAKERFARLAPLRAAFIACLSGCGQSIPRITLEEELSLMLSTAMLIDKLLETLTSGKAVS